MPQWNNQPWQRNLSKTASGKTGAVQIDTKFTGIVTAGWQREATLRSSYLYQIYAYLRSQIGCGDQLADSAEGLLLHPAIGVAVDEAIKLQGHLIRFATVDLAADTDGIRRQLISFSEGFETKIESEG